MVNHAFSVLDNFSVLPASCGVVLDSPGAKLSRTVRLTV